MENKELRYKFKKETNREVGEFGLYECDNCNNDQVEVEVWSDNYVFWLEEKVKNFDNSKLESACKLALDFLGNKKECDRDLFGVMEELRLAINK